MYQKRLIKKFIAVGFASAFCALAVLLSPSVAVKSNEVLADEQVRSVYTNELISSAQASQRPIAVMMPTDKAAQPSYGIGNAKILYEIMEEGEISRQLAIIDDWQGLNLRSVRFRRSGYNDFKRYFCRQN